MGIYALTRGAEKLIICYITISKDRAPVVTYANLWNVHWHDNPKINICFFINGTDMLWLQAKVVMAVITRWMQKH
jgi:hypothetical protein